MEYESYSDSLWKITNDKGEVVYCCKGCGKEFTHTKGSGGHTNLCIKLLGKEEYEKRKLKITTKIGDTKALNHNGNRKYNNIEKQKVTWHNKSKEEMDEKTKRCRQTKLNLYNDENYNNKEQAKITLAKNHPDDPTYGQFGSKNFEEKMINKYGNAHYNNRPKATQTFLDKSEGKYTAAAQFPEVKEKVKQNCLEKSNGKYTAPAQFPETKEKYIEHCLEKSNGEYINSFQFPEVKQKAKDKKLQKYNDENYVNTKKAIETCIKNHNVPYGFMLGKKGIQRKRYKGEIYNSNWEIDFVKLCEHYNISFIRDYNQMQEFIYEDINGKEHNYYPDIYLPQKNLYIEIKPLHGNPRYDYWNNKEIIDIKLNCVRNTGNKIMLVMEDLLYKNPDILLKLIK